ncbi:MAG: acyl carrier protein [Phormidium sp. BM_Day4_Bin.17]|nr:acyl carrier protein [Phormidium sp. BM_Day4_Bin.17]UCJ14547.1 MAG: acyl carrier protein [Phormidium sp. PBR-2020]
MNPEDIKDQFLEVLTEIQTDSGYGGTSISGETRPMTDLEGFDSLLCVEAINMLADKLNVEIPSSQVHKIVLSEDGKQHLTIDESVGIIFKIVNTGET